MAKVPSPAEWARKNTGRGEKVPIPIAFPYVVEPIREIYDEMVGNEDVYVTFRQIIDYLKLRFPNKPIPSERQLRNWAPRFFRDQHRVVSDRIKRAQG